MLETLPGKEGPVARQADLAAIFGLQDHMPVLQHHRGVAVRHHPTGGIEQIDVLTRLQDQFGDGVPDGPEADFRHQHPIEPVLVHLPHRQGQQRQGLVVLRLVIHRAQVAAARGRRLAELLGPITLFPMLRIEQAHVGQVYPLDAGPVQVEDLPEMLAIGQQPGDHPGLAGFVQVGEVAGVETDLQFGFQVLQHRLYLHRDPPRQFLLPGMGLVQPMLVIAPAQADAGGRHRGHDQAHRGDQQAAADRGPAHGYSRIRCSAWSRMSSARTMPSRRAAGRLRARLFSAISTGRSPAATPRRIWSARRAAWRPMSRCTKP